MGPSTSGRPWSGTRALSSPRHAASPCLLLPAPHHHHHHHLQASSTNTLPCSTGDGEFQQVQKAQKRLARDPYKIPSQNTPRRGRRGRKIKGADINPFKTPNLKKKNTKQSDRLWVLLYFSFNSLLAVASLISLPLISPQVYLQV